MSRAPAASVAVQKPSKKEIEIIKTVLRVELEAQEPLPFSTAGNVIKQAVPRIGPANEWAGTGRLTDFFTTYLPELTVEDTENGRDRSPGR